MNIAFELDVDADRQARLAAALGCGVAQLDVKMAPYAKAALLEYVAMVAGNGMPSKATDVLEFRLLTIMQEAFPDRTITEDEISALFHVTKAKGRTLLANVLAKYDYELMQLLRASLRTSLEGADNTGTNFEMKSKSPSVVEFAAKLLRLSSEEYLAPQLKEATNGVYIIRPGEMAFLCTAVGAHRDDLG